MSEKDLQEIFDGIKPSIVAYGDTRARKAIEEFARRLEEREKAIKLLHGHDRFINLARETNPWIWKISFRRIKP